MGTTVALAFAVAAFAAAGGCSVQLAECNVQCGEGRSCPRGSVCGADDFCYEGSEVGDVALCSERGRDAAAIDATDDDDAGPPPACAGETDPVVRIDEPALTGSTSSATHDFQPSCIAATPPSGNEIAHALTFPGTLTSLTLDTAGSSFDTVMYVKAGSCESADAACNDDPAAGGNSARIALTDVAPGTLFVVVDGFSAAQLGSYDLAVSGTVAPGQRCDPGLEAAGVLTCTSGESCDTGGGSGFRCQ